MNTHPFRALPDHSHHSSRPDPWSVANARSSVSTTISGSSTTPSPSLAACREANQLTWVRKCWCVVGFVLLSVTLLTSAACANDDQAPGLGDPGELQRLQIITGRLQKDVFTIAGKDAGQQLVVEGHYATGQTRDLTREVTYQVSPSSIANVDSTGFVTPLAEGTATIIVNHPQTMQSSIDVQVTHIVNEPPVNFPNQIVPIFTKYGCNGGGCHGKSGGQNGFALSLLGFEPTEDYEYLVKEGRGRRVFPAVPDRSLLLTKATAAVPHGGGQRIEPSSPAYRLLRRWVAQGMPYGNDDDPYVERIEVHPPNRIMPRDGNQQLVAIAFYSDGSSEDVTRMTQFESNDVEMAEVTTTGLVTTTKLTGSVAIMARYQGSVGVYRATVPLGVAVTELPEIKNDVDTHVFANLERLGLPPSSICDDSTFIRRVSVDIAGRLPSISEVQSFLADDNPDKRAALIDELLDSTDYADYFANKWSAILRNKRNREEDRLATYAFHDWLRSSFIENKPYDQFVREIVAANGEVGNNPPVAWYREVNDQSAQVEDTAQLFLGLRIQCARCHHHPFEKWSQQDYYGFAAFFSQVGRKRGYLNGESRIYKRRVAPQTQNPKTKQNVVPTGLGSEPLQLTADDDARQALADWMSQPENPFFAKALVNRYWKHFFGRGLVDPEDDMRVTNPACNPELLDALATNFIESDFDLKQLVRDICNSTTYQLSAFPNEWNAEDRQNFSRFYPRRLNAEVLLDSINQFTATTTNFGGVPSGTRAVQLPDNGFNNYFLTVFGRPESSSACECERTGDANLAQSLHLLNSREIQDKLSNGNSRAQALAADQARSHHERVRELYLHAFSREPDDEEVAIAVAYFERHEDDLKRAYEDLVWVLINTKEFMFNH